MSEEIGTVPLSCEEIIRDWVGGCIVLDSIRSGSLPSRHFSDTGKQRMYLVNLTKELWRNDYFNIYTDCLSRHMFISIGQSFFSIV